MLHDEIKDGIRQALKNKDTVRLSVLRGISSSLTNELISNGKTPQDTLGDDDALIVIRRLAKQRLDSIEQFKAGGRPELAHEEEQELEVLNEFLPTLMSRDDIRPIAQKHLEQLGVTEKSAMGRAIGAIMQELKGTADGADVKAVVEELLS